jgi:hypothetical protein
MRLMMLMILGEPMTCIRRGLYSVVAPFKVKMLTCCSTRKVVLIPDLVHDVGFWECLEVLLIVIASKICSR